MKAHKKLYRSEFAVNFFSARWVITSAAQLMAGGTMEDNEKDIVNNCHIYLICKSPAISFSKNSLAYEEGKLRVTANYRIEGEVREQAFLLEFPLLDGEADVKLSKYPHREIQVLDSIGAEVRYLPASSVAMDTGWHIINRELSKLEVLYIGQAFGDGSRTAFERLKNHSTLQQILAQAQYESPDSEIQILAFEYASYQIIYQVDGRAENVISDHRDWDRLKSIQESHLSKHEQICLIEAGLIRYFQPKYNKIYKESFPSDTHKILEGCYDLDFSGLIVEINTDELRLCLFSETVIPREHHICKIDLLDPEKRLGFFYHGRGDGTFFKMPDVIARSPKN